MNAARPTLALVGLGRMGLGLAKRLAAAGIRSAGYDHDPARSAELLALGGIPAESLAAMLQKIETPRIVWLMLPAGAVTEDVLSRLAPQLAAGDLLVDGANAPYRDALRRAKTLTERGIEFVDAGVSGGVWGAALGFCLMLGGSHAAIERLRPLCEALAPAGGWLHCGPVGAGHFVKMVHNGIEYGLMQAYAEGLSILHEHAPFELQVQAIAECWRNGSVVRSWLLDLIARALAEDPDLSSVAAYVEDSGHGRGTLAAAIEQGVPAPALAAALFTRFASRGGSDYAGRLLAKLRQGFGGHAVRAAGTAGADP